LTAQLDPTSELERRIARGRARTAKWDGEAAAVELWWLGGPAYKHFCEQLAGSARQKTAELEAELHHVYGPKYLGASMVKSLGSLSHP